MDKIVSKDLLRHLVGFLDHETRLNFVYFNKFSYSMNDVTEQKASHLKRLLAANNVEYAMDCMTRIDQAVTFSTVVPLHRYERFISTLSWSRQLYAYFRQFSIKESVKLKSRSSLHRCKRARNGCFDSIRTNQILRRVRRRTCMIY